MICTSPWHHRFQFAWRALATLALIPTLVALVILLFFSDPALANDDQSNQHDRYQGGAAALPPVVEQFHIIADDWSVSKDGNDDYQLHVEHRKKAFQWPISKARVCDAIDSKALTAGRTDEVVDAYLERLQSDKSKPLVIKVADINPGGHLFVRQLVTFDKDDAFKKAVQFGSPMLNMDVNEVKGLGAKGYSKKLQQVSESDWRQLSRRRVQ